MADTRVADTRVADTRVADTRVANTRVADIRVANTDYYIAEVVRFTTWCKDSVLDINVTKTWELLIDFRKQPPAVSPITIDGEIVERVEKYRYLGIILDRK